MFLLFTIIQVFSIITSSNGFTIHKQFSPVVSTIATPSRAIIPNRISSSFTPNTVTPTPTPTSTVLYSSSSSFTNPTQEQSVELGIRDWPQQSKSQSTWEEVVKDGETLTRYILQGNGDVTITSDEKGGSSSSSSSSSSSGKAKKFTTGVLIEVSGPASLNWVNRGSEDVIILTPGYEQGGLFLGAAATLVVLCGALIAGVGS